LYFEQITTAVATVPGGVRAQIAPSRRGNGGVKGCDGARRKRVSATRLILHAAKGQLFHARAAYSRLTAN
jgi:hypothetical protein